MTAQDTGYTAVTYPMDLNHMLYPLSTPLALPRQNTYLMSVQQDAPHAVMRSQSKHPQVSHAFLSSLPVSSLYHTSSYRHKHPFFRRNKLRINAALTQIQLTPFVKFTCYRFKHFFQRPISRPSLETTMTRLIWRILLR